MKLWIISQSLFRLWLWNESWHNRQQQRISAPGVTFNYVMSCPLRMLRNPGASPLLPLVTMRTSMSFHWPMMIYPDALTKMTANIAQKFPVILSEYQPSFLCLPGLSKNSLLWPGPGIVRGSLNYPEFSQFYLIKSAVIKVVQRSPYYPWPTEHMMLITDWCPRPLGSLTPHTEWSSLSWSRPSLADSHHLRVGSDNKMIRQTSEVLP